MALSSSDFKSGAATEFVKFFGDKKRLALLDDILASIFLLQRQLNRPLTILDIGGGTGMHAHYLASQGHQVTVVDPVTEMIEQGQKQYQHNNLHWVIDSLPHLTQLKQMKFDVIYSIAAWQYIQPKDRQIAMTRTIQLLQPGGTLTIVWPVPMSREAQFPLSHDQIDATINEVNKLGPQDQKIEVSANKAIPDPDNRMGYIEKNQKVFFHSLVAKSFAPTLTNTANFIAKF